MCSTIARIPSVRGDVNGTVNHGLFWLACEGIYTDDEH